MEGSKDITERTRNNRLDNAFKEVMSSADILSHTLGPLIAELNGLEPEAIRSYLPLEEDGDRIVKLEQEIPTPDGNGIRLDVLFELKIPGKQPIKIEVNLEGQSKRRPNYAIENRAIYYASSLIHDQKGKHFQGDDYDSINKVYSIWFMMSPRKDSVNSIVRHHMVAENIMGSSDLKGCNLMEIIEVNIGESYLEDRGVLGLMSILFSRNIGVSERIRLLEENYKIGQSEYLLRGVTDLTTSMYDMTLDEEILSDRVEDLIEEGKLFTPEQVQEQVQQVQEQVQQLTEGRVEDYCATVRKAVEKGWTIADALGDLVPDDIREEVRSRLEVRGGHSETTYVSLRFIAISEISIRAMPMIESNVTPSL